MPVLNEAVFFHQKTKTLILTDLLLNLPQPQPFWTKWYLKACKIYGKPGISLAIKLSTKDKKATKASLKVIKKWNFERIILSHGEIIKKKGKDVLERSYRWL